MTATSPAAGDPAQIDAGQDQIGKSVAAVQEFYLREQRKVSASQQRVERISGFVGRPLFLALVLAFVAAWIGLNLGLQALGLTAFDPPPFTWLQGIIGLSALLTGTVVLSKQNRLARLADQRAHLDLKVTLLTEQKAAKLIDLLEELRRDLPDVRNRHDAHAQALQQAMSPDKVLAALDEHTETAEAVKASAAAAGEEPPLPAPAAPPPGPDIA